MQMMRALGDVAAEDGTTMVDDRFSEARIVSVHVLFFPVGSCFGVVCIFVLNSIGIRGGKRKIHIIWSSGAGVVAAQWGFIAMPTVPSPNEGVCSNALA